MTPHEIHGLYAAFSQTSQANTLCSIVLYLVQKYEIWKTPNVSVQLHALENISLVEHMHECVGVNDDVFMSVNTDVQAIQNMHTLVRNACNVCVCAYRCVCVCFSLKLMT